mgnify:CR=1 FL=1
MRRNRIRELIALHLEENKAIYLFTSILFLMGITFGAIIVNSLSITQKHDLYMYLNQFFGQVASGELADAKAMFVQSFTHYVKYFGLMWLLGLSIIGLPIILILLFLKGVVVGFTVGFLVNQMGMTGFLLAFLSVMPQNFILVPAFIIVGSASIAFCLKMVRQQFLEKYRLPIFPQFLKYSLFIFAVGSTIIFSSAFEAYVSPTLMKFVIN